MVNGLSDRIEELLRAVDGDEDAFNHVAEGERLDVYMRRGRLYPSAIGQSHTSRLVSGLLSPGVYRCASATERKW